MSRWSPDIGTTIREGIGFGRVARSYRFCGETNRRSRSRWSKALLVVWLTFWVSITIATCLRPWMTQIVRLSQTWKKKIRGRLKQASVCPPLNGSPFPTGSKSWTLGAEWRICYLPFSAPKLAVPYLNKMTQVTLPKNVVYKMFEFHPCPFSKGLFAWSHFSSRPLGHFSC